MKINALHAVLTLVLLTGPVSIVNAQDGNAELPAALITPPAIEEGVLYFVSWPDTLYAFEENENSARWAAVLDPPLESLDRASLPAPAPQPVMSYVLVHLGRQLWGVSKVDGHSVWSISGLPEASSDRSDSTVEALPGYYVLTDDAAGTLLVLEEESGWWQIRKRRLGDGSIDWELRLDGEPRGWWVDGDGICVCLEVYGSEGPGAGYDRPGSVTKYDHDTGESLWSIPVNEESAYRSVFTADPDRIYLTEKILTGEFEVRAYTRDSGELYWSITYEADEIIQVLSSGERLVFLHREGSEEQRLVRFLLYYSSLNPIRPQTLRESLESQFFYEPAIDKSLFMYGSAVYSLYDANLVWQELVQIETVDWAGDVDYLYLWDSAGMLICYDRLTGLRLWESEFNVLPALFKNEPAYGGASLTLMDNRLFASTPAGELIRVDPSNGELYPGVLRISVENGITGNGSDQDEPAVQTGRRRGIPWVWISVGIILFLAGLYYWGTHRRSVTGMDDDIGF